MHTLALLSCLAPLVAAHWKIVYPPQRQYDNEPTMPQFPCGGINTVSTNRTAFPINGGPIQLNSEHTHYDIEVLLAIGNEPGDAFNYIVIPTVSEQGPNNICFGAGAFQLPSDLNITDGTNATIQVQTNGDGTGALYNCADITFTSTELSTEEYNTNCVNSTGVTISPLSGAARNANQTLQGSASGSGSPTSPSATATGAAAHVFAAGWPLAAVAVLAGAFAA